jgi:hypothetical protein
VVVVVVMVVLGFFLPSFLLSFFLSSLRGLFETTETKYCHDQRKSPANRDHGVADVFYRPH